MGYKIKNITHLLNKTNSNHNKPVFIKLTDRFLVKEYQILPYQEMIFDSNLLPIEIKKMEMMGMVKCESVTNNFINSINNPKKEGVKQEVKEQKGVTKKEEKIVQQKRKTVKKEDTEN